MKAVQAMISMAVAMASISLVSAAVRIQPDPNREVGMMNSESRYFLCTGTQKGERLQWTGPNGQEIVSDQAARIYTVDKRNTLKLELKNPMKEDSGNYKCVSKNNRGLETSVAQFKLNVYNPTTVQGNTAVSKNEGGEVTLECVASYDKDAHVEFTWRFNNFDLNDNQKYHIKTERSARSRSRDEIEMVSKLHIRQLSKEHDGKYTCQVDTTNAFIADSKELHITLRVHFAPRFDENTPKHIWISEDNVNQGGPHTVNISCIVHADPSARIRWLNAVNQEIDSSQRYGTNPTIRVTEMENMSTLQLQFSRIEEVKKRQLQARLRYTCMAENQLGRIQNTFDLKVGRMPDSPEIIRMDYKDGMIELALNESRVEPPVDSFRLEVGDEQAHLFNKTAHTKKNTNSTYVIELSLPRGEHKVNIFAHNPVGWSQSPQGSYYLTVVSSAHLHAPSAHLLAWLLAALVLWSFRV